MPRERKARRVSYPPKVNVYKPKGIPLSVSEMVNLNLEEYEAIRLSDSLQMNHSEAASQMNISRPTFTRLLESAHKKIADALTKGFAISIEGGTYNLKTNRYYCEDCKNLWNADMSKDYIECPKCKSTKIRDLGKPFRNGHGHGKGHHRKANRKRGNWRE